jgi:hypothetical protein
MKDLNNFINESISDVKYAIRWYYYADEKMSWSYQSSLNRAQSFIQKMQKQGMKIYEIYEIPSDNVKQFKSLINKKCNNEEQIKKLYNNYWSKSDIEKFLDTK